MNGYWGGYQWGGYVGCRWGGLNESFDPNGTLYGSFYMGFILGL
jgi:hypothetical protein